MTPIVPGCHSGRPKADPESSDFRGLACIVILATMTVAALPAAADPLGRLFTTPQQRQKLEELRRAELEKPEQAPGPSIASTDVPTQARNAPLNAIKVKGLVTRSDGRSTAFLNEGNTYEGDLTSEYIRVRSSDIEGGRITIVTPYGEGAVALKVGQTLEPSTGRVIDVTDEEFGSERPGIPRTPADPDLPPVPTQPGE